MLSKSLEGIKQIGQGNNPIKPQINAITALVSFQSTTVEVCQKK